MHATRSASPEGGRKQPNRAALSDGSVERFTPSRKLHSTFRLTSHTITVVILSRAWDVFFTKYTWSSLDDQDELSCAEYAAYFIMLLPIGGLILGMVARRKGPLVSLTAPVVGMLAGWAFMGVVKACEHPSLDGAERLTGLVAPGTRSLFELLFAVMYITSYLAAHLVCDEIASFPVRDEQHSPS